MHDKLYREVNLFGTGGEQPGGEPDTNVRGNIKKTRFSKKNTILYTKQPGGKIIQALLGFS